MARNRYAIVLARVPIEHRDLGGSIFIAGSASQERMPGYEVQ